MKTVTSIFLGCLVAVGLSGQSIPQCVQGTLASYELLTSGCIVGDKIFSNFTYSASGTNILGADQITVLPLNAGANPTDLPGYGLGFQGGWGVGANQTEDSLLGFRVTIVAGSPYRIDDDTLSIPSYFTAAGGTNTSVTESVCLGGFWSNGSCIGGVVQAPVLHIPCSVSTPGATCTGNNLTMNVGPFGPYSTLGITKDISLIGGSTGCPTSGPCASFSEVFQNFSQVVVPEPTAVLLFGTCLLALWPLRKRLSR